MRPASTLAREALDDLLRTENPESCEVLLTRMIEEARADGASCTEPADLEPVRRQAQVEILQDAARLLRPAQHERTAMGEAVYAALNNAANDLRKGAAAIDRGQTWPPKAGG